MASGAFVGIRDVMIIFHITVIVAKIIPAVIIAVLLKHAQNILKMY